MAFSCDGVHFSEFLRVLESTPASYGAARTSRGRGGRRERISVHRARPGVSNEEVHRSRLVRTVPLAELKAVAMVAGLALPRAGVEINQYCHAGDDAAVLALER